jgi:hypothetical protein
MQVFLHRLYRMRPCKPRNPLLRLACGLIGVALLAVLVVFGLFVGLGMLMFAGVRRMFRPSAAPAAAAAQERIIEGEYAVVTPRTVSMQQH